MTAEGWWLMGGIVRPAGDEADTARGAKALEVYHIPKRSGNIGLLDDAVVGMTFAARK